MQLLERKISDMAAKLDRHFDSIPPPSPMSPEPATYAAGDRPTSFAATEKLAESFRAELKALHKALARQGDEMHRWGAAAAASQADTFAVEGQHSAGLVQGYVALGQDGSSPLASAVTACCCCGTDWQHWKHSTRSCTSCQLHATLDALGVAPLCPKA